MVVVFRRERVKSSAAGPLNCECVTLSVFIPIFSSSLQISAERSPGRAPATQNTVLMGGLTFVRLVLLATAWALAYAPGGQVRKDKHAQSAHAAAPSLALSQPPSLHD